MTARSAYLAALARRVAREDITTSQAVILSYLYDHPSAPVADACRACGVPLACMAGVEA